MFQVKLHTTGKVSFLYFKSFLLVSTKFSFWQEDWTLDYHSMEIRRSSLTPHVTRIHHFYK